MRLIAVAAASLVLCALTVPAAAQAPEPASREAEITRAKEHKSTALAPYKPGKAEEYLDRAEDLFLSGQLHWHPFFDSAYSGGGFTLGAGYMRHVSAYNTIDLRGSITFSGYKRIEAEYRAPRLFDRRATLSVLGGWREATSVGFFGIGTDATSHDDRANYSFQQPYFGARLDIWPTRRLLVAGVAADYSQWKIGSGGGSAPSVDEVYTPETLPGLGAKVNYLHTEGSLGLDWRASPLYARRGGAYSVTFNDFADSDDRYSFQRVDYDAVQHLPLLRETWVLSLHGRVETTYGKDGQEIPFFMLPALGGGSSLRGFGSWRFRDKHSILLQAEWRVMVNRFVDLAVFADAGKVTARRADLDFDGLKNDYGLGFRFHGPLATALRVELAKSNEGLAIVFSSKAAF